MNNWNKTGKIKAIILGLVALPNLLAPIGAKGQQGLSMVLMPLIFGSIAIPLIAKFNAKLGRKMSKPNWNENPLTLAKPLTMFNYFAYIFITVGLSMLIGTGIKFHSLSNFGLTSISFGTGIFIGIRLTLKLTK